MEATTVTTNKASLELSPPAINGNAKNSNNNNNGSEASTPVILLNNNSSEMSSTNNRISTLDACYEVVKEKLERLREEIRRIRINKQQEQLHQTIHAKRHSVDSTSSSSTHNGHQLLVPPTLPGSGIRHQTSISPMILKHSASPSKIRHRLPVNPRTLELHFSDTGGSSRYNNGSSSNDDDSGDENSRTLTKNSSLARSRRQQQNNVDFKRSPKIGTKPRLARQNEINETATNTTGGTTSGKDGSESPIWVPNGGANNNKTEQLKQTLNLPSRHKSLNARSSSPPAISLGGAMSSRGRSKTLRESPHPARLVAEHSYDGGASLNNNGNTIHQGGLSYQIVGENSPRVDRLFLSPASNHQQTTSSQQSKPRAIITSSDSSSISSNSINNKQSVITNGQPSVEKKFDDAFRMLKNQQETTEPAVKSQKLTNIKPAIGGPSPPNNRPMLGTIKALEMSSSKPAINRLSKDEHATPTLIQQQNSRYLAGENGNSKYESGSESHGEQTASSGSIRSRNGSLQSHQHPAQQSTLLSTVVLPHHSSQPAGQVQQGQATMRRPPRSFTVRTNATPEHELEPPEPKITASLPVPTINSGHSMSLSPQKYLVVPSTTVVNVDGASASTSSRSTSGNSQKSLTPSLPLLKNEPPSDHLQPQQHPPRQLIIDAKAKSPSIPVISTNNSSSTSSGNTNNTQPGNTNVASSNVANSIPPSSAHKAVINASAQVKQQAANKLVSAIMGVPTSLLSNDSSSYENLDQQSSSAGVRSAASTSSQSSSAPVPPFPVPTNLANKGSNNNSNSSSSTIVTSSQPRIRHDSLNETVAAVIKPQIKKNYTPPPFPQPRARQPQPQPQPPTQQSLLSNQQQRKSAEVDRTTNNSRPIMMRGRTFPYQRNYYDLVSPPLPSISHAYQDTDSELEGIFGECEAVDDFETSTTMSDSPSLFSDVSVWPVMIGNSVVATKRRPRTVGQQHQARRKDPPRVADATQAALIASRRGSLARPRPTTAGGYYICQTNRSAADLHSAAVATPPTVQVPTVPTVPTVQVQPSQKEQSQPSEPQKLSPNHIQSQQPTQPAQQPAQQTAAAPPSQVAILQKQVSTSSGVLRSPKIAPSTLAALHQQRRQLAQRGMFGTSLNSQLPPMATSSNTAVAPSNTPNTTSAANAATATQIAAAGKPSLTGLLYGTDAANRANQHLSHYAFRAGINPTVTATVNAINTTSSNPLTRQQNPLSRSVMTGNNVSQQPSTKQEIRPLAIGGTLSINNAPPHLGSAAPTSTASEPKSNSTSLAAGQVSIASVIFNNPLQQQTSSNQQLSQVEPNTSSLNRHNHNRQSERTPSSATSADTGNATSSNASSTTHRHRRRGTLGGPIEAFTASSAAAQQPHHHHRHSQVVT